jgi:hypothetical protein
MTFAAIISSSKPHSSVVPGGAAMKDAAGHFIHEDVWSYLFTHPVDKVGKAVPSDPECLKDLREAEKKPIK